MAVLFLIFLDQICPNWIKLDQIGFPHQSKNVTIKICHIYRKDKNGCFVFDFFVGFSKYISCTIRETDY